MINHKKKEKITTQKCLNNTGKYFDTTLVISRQQSEKSGNNDGKNARNITQ